MAKLIGFIGLGQMGHRMAKHLLIKGTPLIVYDVDQAKLDQFARYGARVVNSPGEVAQEAHQIVTMLPTSMHVEQVFDGDQGLFRKINHGTLCIDCSTIDQSVSIQLAEKASKFGAKFLDAPVSGGVLGAEKGTLTFMVGGDTINVDQARPLFLLMGQNVVHCGAVGSGQAVKACNNMLLAVTMIGLAEATNLAIKMGLDPGRFMSVVNTSSGRSWSSDTYNPVPGIIPGTPACSDYHGGFSCQLMAKDLGLAQIAATTNRVPLPLGSLAHQIYRMLAERPDYQQLDFTSVYKFMAVHDGLNPKK